MIDICIIRQKGYIKANMHVLYQQNHRKLENSSNKNIQKSLSKFNTYLVNNLQDGETFMKAFYRFRDNGLFKGQLKVQGDTDKQTKFLDEFLVYPPYQRITEMTLEEQNIFFEKYLDALQAYFPDIIILSAVVHRDEVFIPIDEELKELYPEGKMTPHMHITAIPIVYDKKTDSKKISISELWKGKNSYRKFQDYMYNTVSKEYGFDRGEKHDFGESQKHMEVEAFKLQEAEKSLKKLEVGILKKEMELAERARAIEPEEQINIFNAKEVIKNQKAINLAWQMEIDKNAILQHENKNLYQTIKDKDELILSQSQDIQYQQQKLSEAEKLLSDERERTDELLNIKVSHEGVRADAIKRAKTKIRLFDLLFKAVINHLPDLLHRCPKFIRDLVNIGIISDKDLPDAQSKEERHNR
jgi:hypothetical protein